MANREPYHHGWTNECDTVDSPTPLTFPDNSNDDRMGSPALSTTFQQSQLQPAPMKMSTGPVHANSNLTGNPPYTSTQMSIPQMQAHMSTVSRYASTQTHSPQKYMNANSLYAAPVDIDGTSFNSSSSGTGGYEQYHSESFERKKVLSQAPYQARSSPAFSESENIGRLLNGLYPGKQSQPGTPGSDSPRMRPRRLPTVSNRKAIHNKYSAIRNKADPPVESSRVFPSSSTTNLRSKIVKPTTRADREEEGAGVLFGIEQGLVEGYYCPYCNDGKRNPWDRLWNFQKLFDHGRDPATQHYAGGNMRVFELYLNDAPYVQRTSDPLHVLPAEPRESYMIVQDATTAAWIPEKMSYTSHKLKSLEVNYQRHKVLPQEEQDVHRRDLPKYVIAYLYEKANPQIRDSFVNQAKANTKNSIMGYASRPGSPQNSADGPRHSPNPRATGIPSFVSVDESVAMATQNPLQGLKRSKEPFKKPWYPSHYGENVGRANQKFTRSPIITSEHAQDMATPLKNMKTRRQYMTRETPERKSLHPYRVPYQSPLITGGNGQESVHIVAQTLGQSPATAMGKARAMDLELCGLPVLDSDRVMFSVADSETECRERPTDADSDLITGGATATTKSSKSQRVEVPFAAPVSAPAASEALKLPQKGAIAGCCATVADGFQESFHNDLVAGIFGADRQVEVPSEAQFVGIDDIPGIEAQVQDYTIQQSVEAPGGNENGKQNVKFTNRQSKTLSNTKKQRRNDKPLDDTTSAAEKSLEIFTNIIESRNHEDQKFAAPEDSDTYDEVPMYQLQAFDDKYMASPRTMVSTEFPTIEALPCNNQVRFLQTGIIKVPKVARASSPELPSYDDEDIIEKEAQS